ncbi:MAG: AmmeMemoRadiSam system protein A [Phycisphaerae bacterium]|nr:AmmeMemoRadiSam system protein A [Phycisphaerae bacterium]
MPIPPEERETLLTLARQAVAAAVTGQAPPRPDQTAGVLAETRGCFVTLHSGATLRGCIGTFTPSEPLGETIVKMAVAAATQDPRFVGNRIMPDELDDVSVELSVLSPLEPTGEPLKDVVAGTHGIYVKRGWQSGCFLPEVAIEMGWDVEQFLDHCCASKAGLPPGAWREPDTQVFRFTTEKIA